MTHEKPNRSYPWPMKKPIDLTHDPWKNNRSYSLYDILTTFSNNSDILTKSLVFLPQINIKFVYQKYIKNLTAVMCPQ